MNRVHMAHSQFGEDQNDSGGKSDQGRAPGAQSKRLPGPGERRKGSYERNTDSPGSVPTSPGQIQFFFVLNRRCVSVESRRMRHVSLRPAHTTSQDSQITAKSNSQPPRGLALHLSGAMRITNAVCIYPGLSYVKKCELDEPVEKYQNQGTGFSAYVEAWYTCADCAEQIRSNGPDSACDAVGKHHIVSVGSVNCGDVADGNFRDIGDVDHRYVHGNNADNRRERSAYEDFAFVAERTMNAVAISGGENGNF